jgi:predicted Zn-dependent protease with MMP-like domain
MKGQGQLAPNRAEIEAIARAAMAQLPDPFAAHLKSVVLIVEDFPADSILNEMAIEDPFALSGLYSGRPVGETAQTGDLPATIHLFRRPILDEWADGRETLENLVRHILIHEVGHHFGLSDADMHALEDAVA